MKHIKQIWLQGFQSHQASALYLVPGLNIITGPSDSGKTAIIRGLRWALYNEPAGDAMLNAQVEEAFVAIMLADSNMIVRTRGKNLNEYKAGDQTYTGFGTGVPLEISQLHGMPKATVGDQEISLNINFQLDPPFLLSETSGAAARLLGKLAGTEEIDAAIKDINSELHRIRQDRTTLGTLIESTEHALERYEDLDRQCEQAAEARELWTSSTALIERAELLKKLREVHTYIQDRRRRLEKQCTGLIENQRKLERRLGEAQTAVSDHGTLLRIQTRYVSNRYQLAQIIDVLKRTAALDSLGPLVEDVKARVSSQQRLADLHRKHQITTAMRNHWTRIMDETYRTNEASKGLHTLSAELARITLLQRQFDRFVGVSASVERQKSILQHTVEVDTAANRITAARIHMHSAETLRAVLLNYQDKFEKSTLSQNTICFYRDKEKTTRTEFERYLEDLGVCPFCGSQLDAELIAKGA